ncbi:methylmalonyl Co-A mutase-associated GTPase MeaB, partial [Pseudomonas otitidis]|nr:methylmalonyl Co-A mutase-associated GTPase MeaB [Pseudomonas otitidis]
AVENEGVAEFWNHVQEHHKVMLDSGTFEHTRREQQVQWMWSMVHETLLQRLNSDPEVVSVRKLVETQLRQAQITPTLGAEKILRAFDHGDGH